jgi:hypothetical protein
LYWSFQGRCPNCGSSERFERSRRRNFREQCSGVLFLPYRCDQCDFRFFRLRWLSRQRQLQLHEPSAAPLWTRGRLRTAMALMVIAASLAIMVVRWSPNREAREGTANPTGTVLIQRDAPASPPTATEREVAGADRIDQRAPASTTRPPLRDSHVSGGVKNGSYLISRGSVVVIAADEATALRLRRRRRPENLSELIRQGSVFSVPTGTAAKILARNVGLVQVRILDTAMAGRDGWVQPGQLALRRQR